MNKYSGEITARVVDVRFASGGRIASVFKHTGDIVKKGNLIALLDRKIFQLELDRKLADFEKVRADFEIFNEKNPNPQETIDKYLKTQKQASLNASVKEVEIAKANLDLCDLFSPVDGVIIDDNGIVPGQNVTPASSSIKVVDTSSYFFEFAIEQKDIPNFRESKKCRLEITGIKEKIEGETLPVYSNGKKFIVKVKLSLSSEVLTGMTGKAVF